MWVTVGHQRPSQTQVPVAISHRPSGTWATHPGGIWSPSQGNKVKVSKKITFSEHLKDFEKSLSFGEMGWSRKQNKNQKGLATSPPPPVSKLWQQSSGFVLTKQELLILHLCPWPLATTTQPRTKGRLLFRVQQNHPGWTAAEELQEIRYITEFFQKVVNPVYLEILRTDSEAWQRFVAVAGLPRDEANALYETLKKRTTDVVIDDKGKWQNDRPLREWFLKKCPQLRRNIQESIREIYALADGTEKVHRDSTISNVVSYAAGTASGIMSILGFVLAPFTGGVSLALTTAGAGLGTLSLVAGFITRTVEDSHTSSAHAEANRLSVTSTDKLKEFVEVMREMPPDSRSRIIDFYKATEVLGEEVRAMRGARAGVLHLRQTSAGNDAGFFLTSERTNWLVGRGGRMTNAASIGIPLVLNVVNLVYESKHLLEGANSWSAEDLRQQARMLEVNLRSQSC
ncbi:apolipoprotein L3-like [Sapajus apella]|uniref:Apolipoprotein L3-like n=1 Tax=Sapajus apella TaxID=9515 RepID=A0A6J3H5S9_SAPAP|nr:apolipoprotein L3-like [Sapajus apella]